MRAIPCLLLLSLPVFAATSSSPVPRARQITVLLDFENSHSRVPLKEMKSELQSILSGAGVALDLRLKDELPADPQFGELLVFKMQGHCSLDESTETPLVDERGPLAMTYSSDGEMLSFGAVQCDKIRDCLEQLYGQHNVPLHSAVYGRALGRAVAHEMYHMIAKSTTHTKDGVTKESLSAWELTENSLHYSAATDAVLREALKDSLP